MPLDQMTVRGLELLPLALREGASLPFDQHLPDGELHLDVARRCGGCHLHAELLAAKEWMVQELFREALRQSPCAPTLGDGKSQGGVLAAVSFTQFGATEVPMARAALAAPSGSSSACVRAHALKVAQDRHRAQDYPRSDREPSATALAPGPAFQPLIVAAPGGAASATPRRHGARYASVTPRARVNSDAGATISCPPARQAAHRLQLQSPERAGHEEPQEAPEELGGLPSLAPRGAAISRHTSPTGRLPVLGTAGRAATLSEEASLHRRLKFASTQPEIPMPGRLMPLWPG
ncbi:unnamed protein product [Prorocentrum cordatum]|uniref:Uncharacterized protein n=1 Tax=Prorocentrum cordatum TaxID=2364126 RepID=A0ABN9U4P4_9DINO|nr:unnamed protein product [Polarella glacialis]